MKEEIKAAIHNPKQLETLYRDNKTLFRKSFAQIFPEIQDQTTAQVWYERLNHDAKEISWGTSNDLWVVIMLALLAGILAKIPIFTGIAEEFYYPRNISFVVLPILSIYFAWKQQLSIKKWMTIAALVAVAALYINILPDSQTSDTLILACIHLPLFLWTVLGYSFTGPNFMQSSRRLDFLRFNGDLVVMTTVILIAGGILSGITIGLFNVINLNIEEYYFEYVAVWGLAAAPLVATYLIQANPQLVKNISPVIARVFTPLVLVMLTVYLTAIVYTGKDPYNDRDFLIIFNLLLIGVMAIILFSLAEISKSNNNKTGVFMLLSLSILTIMVNGIALSAILFRIFEWGITPNRLAVLGGNILILTNLLIVTYNLFRTLRYNTELENVDNSIARFLPIYSAWTVIVTFLFPLIFGFK